MSKRDWQKADFWDTRFREGTPRWDIGMPSPTLVELERTAELLPGSAVLVPGCGHGHDAIHFAKLGYEVSAVDWSNTAVDDLRVRARRADVPMELLRSDFFEIPAAWHETFDVWVEHTFFCAIDPSQREAYVEQVLNLLKPRGRFLGALFLTEEEVPSLSINHPEEGQPFWSTPAEIERLFSPHFEIIKLERSPLAPGNRAEFEWVAHFARK